MGEYAPDDQRTVHNNEDGHWQNKEDGSQAKQSQTQKQSADQSIQAEKDSQMGYGNARDTDGQMEQQASRKDDGDTIEGAQPRETSSDPAQRLRGDANRPLDGG